MFIHASIDSVSYLPMIIVRSLWISFIVESPSVMILPFMLIAHRSEGVAISRYRSILRAWSIIFGAIWIPPESLIWWTVATCTKVKNCTILHILGFGVVWFSLGFNYLTWDFPFPFTILGHSHCFLVTWAKIANWPKNPNNLVSRLVPKQYQSVTSRALKARFWARKSSL